jgi:hypothetical protein
MAFYQRSDHVSVHAKYKNGRQDTQQVCVMARSAYIPEKESVISIGFSLTDNTESSELPLYGTPYQLVFEVRKDGTPHPHAWAKLPAIGGYENWGQANSWVVRIGWQDPPNSGKWRFKYLQAVKIWRLIDESIPGSLSTYPKSIAFLQWLTGSKPNHNHPWIPRIPGAARVLQAKYDFMSQSIEFEEPTDQINMLPGRPLSMNAINLVQLPAIHPSLTSFTQKLRELGSSEQLLDDGSDAEDDEDSEID